MFGFVGFRTIIRPKTEMQKTLLIFLFISVSISGFTIEPTLISNKSVLSGKITDLTSGELLPGVTIYFPDLKTGTVSKPDGTYRIDNLPSARILVQVSFVGYQLMAQNVDLSKTNQLDFVLNPSVTEINEVVVTGQSIGAEKNLSTAPIIIIPATYLLENSATNMIDALASKPGISQITTGAGISKPVIRGLGFNRVVVVNDGIRQEGQQWGDEHGIEIDEFAISRAEILKGPASLAYGSDAVAGVISLMSAPILPEGQINGNLLSNYQTNNGLFANSINFAGNKNGLIWDFRASDKRAHAYQNKFDGPVYNSGFSEQAINALAGINRSWGFSHIHLSTYQLKPGIVEGTRDSITGQFVKPSPSNGSFIPTNSSDFNSYSPDVPYQLVNHFKAVLDNSFYLGQGNLKVNLGYQQNRRKEFSDFSNPDQSQLYFLLNTVNYNFRYTLPEKNNFNLSIGLNGMWQQSENKGLEFLVPAYHLFDAGVFAIAKKSLGKINLSGGLRADRRWQTGNSLYLNKDDVPVPSGTPEATERFAGFSQTFNGISGSLGISYQVNKSFYTNVNIARGYRAPNIGELGSNGVHEGTLRYETGNSSLKPENSLQFDFTAGMNIKHVAAELNLFNNTIDNFIYSRKEFDPNGNPLFIHGYPAFLFTSGKANLQGGEFTLDIHPHPIDWIHFENSFSYVQATLKNQPDSSHYLPFTPPFHWNSELRFDFEKKIGHFQNMYLKSGFDWYASQNHVYSAYGTETASQGYFLINMGAGTDFISAGKTRFSMYLVANNFTNVAYQSHLSRLKYAESNLTTGRAGIYNMGRNISIKLLIPVSFAK